MLYTNRLWASTNGEGHPVLGEADPSATTCFAISINNVNAHAEKDALYVSSKCDEGVSTNAD